MFSKKTLTLPTVLIVAVAGIVGLATVPASDDAATPVTAHPRPVSGADPLECSDEVEPGELTRGASPAPAARLPVESAAAPTGAWSIAGRVRLGANGSLPDAPLLVTLHAGFEATGPALIEARIRSDANGEFTWTTPAPGETVTVHVIPELEGHKVYAGTRVAVLGDPPPSELEPRAYSLSTLITGRVLDGDGKGIADATVFSHLSEVRTNDDGRYALPMDPAYRSPTFRALAEGFACEPFAVGGLRPGELQGPDVVLREELAVRGRVVDAAGVPIAGATISSYPFDRLRTTSSTDGTFRLGGLDPAGKRTTVHARMEGLVADSQRVDAESLKSATDTELEFVLTRGASLSGRVVTEQGQPIANAVVCFNGVPSSSGPHTTRTDEEGAFELTGVRRVTNRLWARRKGWAAERIQLTISETDAALTGLEIVLTRGFGLTGILLDETGRPIAGAEIRPEKGPGQYVGDSVHSGEDGRFVLEQLRDEEFMLRALAPGFASHEQYVQAGSDVVLRARRAGGLAGRVVDGATGSPIDSFVVRFVPAQLGAGEAPLTGYGYEWSRIGVSFAGTGGAWDSSSETLALGAVTGVEISAPGYASTLVDHVVVTSAPKPAGLRIELYAGATLRGFVTEATTGAPLRDARIRRFTAGNPHDPRRYIPDEDCEARTDEHGRFQLERVPFGAMFLVVDQTEQPLYIDGPFEVAASASTLERAITVSSGGRVVGRYLDGDGQPLANQRVTLRALETPVDNRPIYTTETDSKGAFEFEQLSAGPHHLQGTITRTGSSFAAGAGMLQLLLVEEDRTLEFDLQPIGRATLKGTIEYDGELPEEVSVMLIPEQVPGVWAKRSVTAGVHERSFSAPYLDAGEWNLRVLLQVDGEMVHGGAKVQVPEEGTAEVHLILKHL